MATNTPSKRNAILIADTLTLSGDITAPSYNNSNWDTAYGWGNHASAGYLTTVPSEYLTQTEGDARYALPSSVLQTVYQKEMNTASAGYVSFEFTGYVSTIGRSHYVFDVIGYKDFTDAKSFVHYTVYLNCKGAFGGTLSENTITADIVAHNQSTDANLEFKLERDLGPNNTHKLWISIDEGYSGIQILSYPTYIGSLTRVSASAFDFTATAPTTTTVFIPSVPLLTTGGTLTGNLTLNSATPEILFNGTSDVGVDMAIRATPEGLDFYEPEDTNKIHFQILDDTGVNSPFGYKVGGVRKDLNWDTAYGWGNHASAGYLTSLPSHVHTIANITGLQTALNGKVDDSQVLTNVPSGAVFTDTVYSHPSSHPATMITTTDEFTYSDSTNVQDVLDDLDQAIANVNAKDLTLTLSGDVTGSATFTNLGNATLTATVINDSHNHNHSDGNFTVNGDLTTGSGGDISTGAYANITSYGNVKATNGSFQVGTTTVIDNARNADFASIDVNGHVTLSDSGDSIVQNLESTSNYGAIAKWYKGGTSQATYDPQIGHHNTGGTGTGSISIIPFATATSPWGGTQGLYLTQTGIKFNNNNVFRDDYHPNADKWTTARTLSLTGDVTGSVSWDGSANASITTVVANDSHTHDGRYVNVTGDTMTGNLNFTADNVGITYTGHSGIYMEGKKALWSHNNGHVTLSAAGGDLYLGYNSGTEYVTGLITLHADTYNSTKATKIIDHDTGRLWSEGSRTFADNYHPNADKWTSPRVLTLTGDVSGTVTWDGSANVSMGVVVLDDSHSHANYITSNADDTTSGSISTAINKYFGYASTYRYTPYTTGGIGTRSELISAANFLIHADTDGSGASEFVSIRAGAGTANELKLLSKTSAAGVNNQALTLNGNKVFNDAYHPNADKWTTARTNTVTLTGDASGSGSASVDGTGNWTVSVPVVVNNDSHNHDHSDGSFTVNGTLTVAPNSTSSYILMGDTDNGSRYIHCNSDRIGFLSSAGGWGSWSNDDGSWQTAVAFGINNTTVIDSGLNLTNIGKINAGAITNDNTGAVRILHPDGASYTSNGATGAIKIRLPVLWTNTMMRMSVKVYEYTTGESFDVNVGGYNHTGGGGLWYNTFAQVISDPDTNRNFTVRYGHDGTRACIWIGETNSSWSYPKVSVVDFQAGHSAASEATWASGWAITIESSLGTIQHTHTNNEVGIDGYEKRIGGTTVIDSSRNLTNIGTISAAGSISVTGYNSVSAYSGAFTYITGALTGNVVGNVTGSAGTATKWATPRTITLGGDLSGSVSIDGSANVTLSAQVSNNSHSHNYIFSDVQSSAPSNALQYLNTQGNSNDSPTNDWYNTIRMGHGDPNTYYNNTLAVRMTGSDVGSLWGRTTSNGTKGTWRRFFADDYHPNADKWTTARTLSLTGDVTGSVSWDGSANASITATVANNSHTHTVDNISGLVEGTSFSGEYASLFHIGGNRIFSDASMRFRGSDSRLTVDGIVNTPTYQVNGTTVIDSGRNITVGAITASGKLYFNKDGQTNYHSVIDIDHVENNLWPFVFQSSTVGNDNESGFWVGNNGYPDMRLRRDNATVRALISSWETSYVSNNFNVAGGDLQVGGTTVIDSARNATVNKVTATASGMSEFSTDLSSNDDYINSPISIRERNMAGSAASADMYAPNLNFHWSGRWSNSLWMNSSGHLVYGGYGEYWNSSC